jgi:uncharacterized protein YciI/uncharacterized protein YndB with AHSA1/START domain
LTTPSSAGAVSPGSVPPIRREIVVDADQDTAFEAFTARIGRWWPLAELSVHGAGSTVEFLDGQIIERSAAGETATWGAVTSWNPPAMLAFTWHPGQAPDRASQVRVTFTDLGERTRVRLEHTGWEVFEDPAAARAEYNEGWPPVLEHYRADVASRSDSQTAAEDEPEETWVALLHRPGPTAPAEGTIFDDPRFAWHVEFLGRMREAGYLVAAGPLPDEPGAGLTVLRLPGGGQIDKARKLATEDDQSVAGGLLTVAVRPWQVLLRA